MIIIGGGVINPLYTRVTISRAFIQAEIAIHSKILKNPIQPSTPIYVSKYGIMYIDNVVQQGENIILRTYDPLAYYCKYRFVTIFNAGSETLKTWRLEKNATRAMYEFLNSQTVTSDLAELHITLNPPGTDEGNSTLIDARYDNVFDIYTKIPESYEPRCRMDIQPVASSGGDTTYQPQLGAELPKRIETPYVVDYAQRASFPTQALVQGSSRSILKIVGEGMRQIYVNRPMTPVDDQFITDIANNALTEAKYGALNLTVRMLEKNLPDIKPADSILLNDDTTYTVYSIEHATSPQGEIAYLSCGGHVMSISDRLNALVAADYKSRM